MMNGPARKVDLSPKKAPDPIADAYRNPAVATPTTPAASALTARVVTLRIKVRNPETGDIETLELESTAADRGARLRMAREAVRMAGSEPLTSLFPGDLIYLSGLARIIVQCSEIPESKLWILDDPGNVAALTEALIDHDQRYFRGDPGEGQPAAFTPVVERPWSRDNPPVA